MSGASPRQEAKAAFVRGETAYNLGKFNDAIAAFEEAYALSRLPEILFNLGQCYRRQWETDKRSELGRRALHYYEALSREAPTSPVRQDAEQFIAELRPAVAQAEANEREGLIAAAHGGEAVKLARTLFLGGQGQDAAIVLRRLLHEPDHERELLAEAYLLLGRVSAGAGDVLDAEAQFRRALELRPSAELTNPRGSELAAFEAAKHMAGSGLRLVQAPFGEVPARTPARIDVAVEGDTEKMVSQLELGYRRADTGAFLNTRAAPPAPLNMPAAVLTPGAHVDYYVRALDSAGSILAESGNPALPFRLQVASPPLPVQSSAAPVPWYQHWWLWTAAGVVAAGTATGIYLGTRPESLPTFGAEAGPRSPQGMSR